MDGKETKKNTEAVVDIDNLPNCILDAYKAGIDGDPGPKDPTDYYQLLGRLVTCREKLPPLYRDAVYDPYLLKFNAIGQAKFTQILLGDPNLEGDGLVVLDIAQAILQNGEGYNEKATDAFQEVVSDLYDGFLSAEDRRNVKKPDKEVIPPLVKWGRPDYGPYTLPIDATKGLGLKVATVNLPPANARTGLYAWAALGHETTGHDILSADDGLLEELSTSVEDALAAQRLGYNLPEYWSSRIDETASDILGILNIGPAAALGIIGYLRGLSQAFGGKPVLRNGGDEDDYHPSDIIRGYLAASAIRLLKFEHASAWADIVETETKKDASTILLDGEEVDFGKARQSAEIVASTLVNRKMESLENHSLGQIQNWYNSDEKIVEQLRTLLTTANQLPTKLAAGIYAAHVVAAAIISAAAKGADVPLLFDRMLTILKAMHDANPSWGPLYIVHPGDLARRFTYSGYGRG